MHPINKRGGFLSLIVASVVLMQAAVFAGSYPGSEDKVVQVVKRVKPSLVYIVTTRDVNREPAVGSGIIIKADGFIITNNHVIKKAKAIKVYLWNGQHYSATVVKTSPAHDLAVIKIDATGLTAAKWGDSSRLDDGQLVISMGSPMKFRFSTSVGCVSGQGRSQTTRDASFPDLIQTDAAINPGSSGGPLLNSSGEIIGINSLVYTGDPKYPNIHPQGIAFAIPSNIARRVAEDLMSGKAANTDLKPWLGVKGNTITRDQAQTGSFPIQVGVYVKEVESDSPAQAAGLKPKDLIAKVNGKVIKSLEELSAAINTLKPDDTVELGVWHEGKFYLMKARLEAKTGTPPEE